MTDPIEQLRKKIAGQVKSWEIAQEQVANGYVVTLSKNNKAIEENLSAWKALEAVLAMPEHKATPNYFLSQRDWGYNQCLSEVHAIIAGKVVEG